MYLRTSLLFGAVLVAAAAHVSCAARVPAMRRFQAYDGPLRPAAETARVCGLLVAVDGKAPLTIPSQEDYIACVDVLPGKHVANVDCVRGPSVISSFSAEVEWTAVAGKNYVPRCEVATSNVDFGSKTSTVTHGVVMDECAECPQVSDAVEEPNKPPPFSPGPGPGPRPRGDSATVYFYRYRAYPLARSPDILLDDTSVPEPAENTYTWIQVPAGTHRVRIKWAFDIPKPVTEFRITLAAAESYFVRISDGPTLQPSVQPRQPLNPRVKNVGEGIDLVERTDAEAEVGRCCVYGGPKR